MTYINQQKRYQIILASIIVLLLSLCTALPVHASGGTCGADLSWSLSGGSLTISGIGEMTNFTDENMPPWYGEAEQITKITVGEGVTNIGQLAFYGCSNVGAVSLPSTLKTIGVRSFKGCTSLSYIGFPAGLEMISEAAFEECTSLSGIRLPNGLKVIDNYAFYRCSGLTSITIPASVIRFGMVTFAYCENLTQATINCAISKLPDWTFYECGKLSSVVLPDTVSSTGDLAFHECDQLVTIHYAGVSQEALDAAAGSGVIITDEPQTGPSTSGSGTFKEDGSGSSSTNIKVEDTGNATTTTETKTESSFTVNGEPATREDLESGTSNIDVESKDDVTISATVDNSDGWTEVEEQVKEALENHKDEIRKGNKIHVIVRIPESKADGSDLVKVAEDAVDLEIITKDGDSWRIDASTINKKKTEKKTYDFGISVKEAEKTDIKSDIVFQVNFEQDSDFFVTVGIYVGYPGELATLYQKKGGDYEQIQTSVIDRNGKAWFSLATIDKNTDYFIGINVEGITDYDAVIPGDDYDTYHVEEDEATLTDASGKAYKITGRSSAWGITGSQFMLYVGIVMGVVILIVALAMFTLNKIRQSKEKYAIDEEDDGPIDEEALRLKVMQELLEEAKASNAKSRKKVRKKD